MKVVRFRATLVWFTPVWRDIEVKDNQTLVTLHRAIQDAFQWYDDHLYAFFMGGWEWDSGSEIMYSEPESLREQGTDDPNEKGADVSIGRLGLSVGRRIAYVYDFGDNLSVTLLVRSVLEEESSVTYPKVTALRGYSPEQYNYHVGYGKRVSGELGKGLPKIVRIDSDKMPLKLLRQWSDL